MNIERRFKLEICRQKLLLVKEQSFEYNTKINNRLDVINFITDIIKIHNEAQEVVYLLTVNSKNQIVGFIEIARRRNKLLQFIY